MTLFSSIHLASNSLRAAQTGLQVVGQNIANANTPGYSREEVVLSPAPTRQLGDLLIGTGVRVEGIIQKVDRFLNERLRNATSDRAQAEIQEQTYLRLESLLGALGETDLGSLLSDFSASISEVINQPESVPLRNLAVLQGEALTTHINRLGTRAAELRTDLNGQVVDMADEMNRLTEEIRTLNVRIASSEGGDASGRDAVGLRDQREIALSKLAGFVDIQIAEQPSGGVAVFTGGEYLVFEGLRREVTVAYSGDRGLRVADLQLAETGAPVEADAGRLGGLVTARDAILGGFLDGLDNLSTTLAFEFNKVFSSGQGLTGHEEVTSQFAVEHTNRALDDAGLKYTPENGSFSISVQNQETGLSKTTTILVDLNGLNGDTTLEDLAASLDAIDGVQASISFDGQLTVGRTEPSTQLAFDHDTSGILAALGINTFFVGSSATDLGVHSDLVQDPSKFSASRGGIGENVDNAIEMVTLFDRALDSANGVSVSELNELFVADVTQNATVAKSVADGFRLFEDTLQGQQHAVSGVNIDEEAIRMITFQRTFQATARYISTISELLEQLVNL